MVDYSDEEDQGLYEDPEAQPETDDDDAIEIVDDEESDLNYAAGDKTPAKEEVKEKVQPQKEKVGNPYAALRIATRENNILSERLSRVLSVLEQQRVPQQEPEQEQEEEIDYSTDPIGAVNAKVEKLLHQTEKEKKEKAEQEYRESIAAVEQQANKSIENFRSKVGEKEYDAAIEHLVKLRISDLQDAYPNATQDELGRAIMQEAVNEKLRLVQSGKNPGEVFYGYAMRHGFKPTRQADKEQQVGTRRIDPREAIQRSKEREAKSKTIASVSGKPPRTISADDFVGMSEDDFDSYVSNLAKRKGTRAGQLGINDILNSAR